MHLTRAALILALFAAPVSAAAEPVDLELVLAIDSSASVNYDEFRLQMLGLAKAFRDPAVVNAIRSAAPDGIAVSLVEWSGSIDQAQVIGWHKVSDTASAEAFAARIDAAPRAVLGGATGVGSAMIYASGLFKDNGFEGRRRVIDISGDGTSNDGPWPGAVRDDVLALGITVNGLAIINEERRLDAYYLAAVAGGPGSFVLIADDYEDFSRAIRLKLITEITGAPIARAPGGGMAVARAAVSTARPGQASYGNSGQTAP